MFVESIPKDWLDPKTQKRVDLTKQDLPKPAVFQSDYPNHRIFLYPMLSRFNDQTKKDERIPGTGVRVICHGGSLVVGNSRLLELVMANPAYRRGIIRIDYSDPTGFWRDVGMVEVRTVQVAVFDSVKGILQFDDLKNRLKDVKVEKDEEGNIVPVPPLLMQEETTERVSAPKVKLA